jgi:CRISPR-associated endoribonuclease Cas6
VPAESNLLTRWLLQIDIPEIRNFSLVHAHAVVSSWVDIDHHAGRKSFSLGAVNLNRNSVGIELRTFSDETSDRLQESFSGAPYIRIGSQRCEEASLQVVESTSFESLIENSDNQDSLNLEFVTPVVFRSGSRYSVIPHHSLVFGHSRRVWTLWAPSDLVPELELRDLPVLTPFIDGSTKQWDLGKRSWDGFVGRVQYDLTLLDEREVRVLNVLGQFLNYVGVGANTTWGMGVVNVTTPHRRNPSSAKSTKIKN